MIVASLFERIEHAAEAVDAMVDAGFAKGELVIVARERVVSEYLNHVEFGPLAQGPDAEAGAGLAIGALAGLLAGEGIVVVPEVGTVFVVGELAVATGSVSRAPEAAAGGLVEALVVFGLTEDEAKTAVEGVRNGGVLLVAQAEGQRGALAVDIMKRSNTVDWTTGKVR